MPSISKKKRNKISEQILSYLYNTSPEASFTVKIAEEIIRDEEFTKSLLEELEKSKLVTKVTKGPNGQDYQRWERWRMSNAAFEAYKNLR
ncbi:hypothetical protein J4423_05285 [Candidatus Pacearchaeota archaeon]|nr:hypothetical protein [Candidatus Pacearchaeota archaeon]